MDTENSPLSALISLAWSTVTTSLPRESGRVDNFDCIIFVFGQSNNKMSGRK